MCTLTAHRQGNGRWHITMNRDELRSRADGEAPFLWLSPEILAPRDPVAGGTWIGVHADGTWAAILNSYSDDKRVWRQGVEAQSRGRLIPLALASADPVGAIEATDLSATMGFRLWIGRADVVAELFWDGQTLRIQRNIEDGPWFFTSSSSLRQPEIVRKRRAVFDAWRRDGAPLSVNGIPSLFTDPHGLGKEEAILMERDYAHTKSCTQISVEETAIRMQHWDATHIHGAAQTSIEMPRSV
ncbi:MAG: NRDE family protein [Pseudomonadota bacterium]